MQNRLCPLFLGSLIAVSIAVGALAQDHYVAEGGPDEPAGGTLVTDSACGCTASEPCQASCLWTSPTMTGDWLGYRSCLQESGVTFAGRVTQFGFGIDGGINTPLPPTLPCRSDRAIRSSTLVAANTTCSSIWRNSAACPTDRCWCAPSIGTASSAT